MHLCDEELFLIFYPQSDYYNHQVFEEDCQFIFDGEVVATCQGDYWFRAKVLKCSEGEVLVSYGNNLCTQT